MSEDRISRRSFGHLAAFGMVGAMRAVVAAIDPTALQVAEPKGFRLRYVLASSMYGRMKLADILPEVRRTGAGHIDVWPEKHADQREQIEQMGHGKFAELLRKHDVRLGILSHYDLGPFGLREEVRVARKLGGSMVVCAGMPKTKAAAEAFVEKMKPHVAAAAEAGAVIGIENHGESPDAIRWFAEAVKSRHLGVALAPYHLEQNPAGLAELIVNLGPKLVHFYAWQHGMGCQKKLPKAQELLQMPGRGELDFAPILAALKRIGYTGWTEVFMHPVPRGIPILPTAAEVTAEINRARKHLDGIAARL